MNPKGTEISSSFQGRQHNKAANAHPLEVAELHGKSSVCCKVQIAGDREAYMSSPLLKDGLLEDGLTFSSINHVVNFSLCGFLACDDVRSPLHHLPTCKGLG